MNEQAVPQGFKGISANVGLRESGDDCLLVASSAPATASAVFTQSLFAGPSVALSRESVVKAIAFQGIVVIAKNANVATGKVGERHARELQCLAAKKLGLEPSAVLVASTGVIGQLYDMAAIQAGFSAMGSATTLKAPAFEKAAQAIMTTDTTHKVSSTKVGNASILGIAKGVGMIEPNMATMLTFFFTDAALEQPILDQIFKSVVAKTFNALSVDSDTSTSDTAAIFANGLAGAVDHTAFAQQLEQVAVSLVKQIAIDGEGATKRILACVRGARDTDQAKRAAKSIINSLLVKTAVHGEDPNWGRVAMALGKLHEDKDIDPNKVQIAFGDHQVYPLTEEQDKTLQLLKQHLAQDEVHINVNLNIAEGEFTAYGCDLSEGYVRINADYTT